MAAASTWRLVRCAATLRWALSRWPRRPELDAHAEPASAWARFQRNGGFSGFVHDAFRRRLSPSGKALGGIWFASFVVTRIPGGNLADLAFAIISASMLVSWLLSCRRPELECMWHVDGTLCAGGTGEIRLELRNVGARTIVDPGAWFFRCADGIEFPGDGLHVRSLRPGEQTILRIPVRGRLRGPAFLDAPHLLALEPLGLMRSSRRASGDCVVVVRPRMPFLRSFRFLGHGPAGAAFAPFLGMQVERMGDPGGVRDYRRGDSMRDLHHRSWARRGRPVTRERLAGRGDGICLVVSSSVDGFDGRMLVDGTLALAASVARWLAERGSLGGAWVDGERIEGERDRAEAVLEACARVPRVGWRRWSRPALAVPERDASLPVLVVAAALPDGWAAFPWNVKIVIPDWGTDSVAMDENGRVLRYRPDLPFGSEISL